MYGSRIGKDGSTETKKEVYPYNFTPTLHKYRLDEYKDKKGRNIFVCSMSDLFGKLIPDDWKIEVLEACARAPQHNYIFLTKNPEHYPILPTEKFPKASEELYTDNMWLGVTYTGSERILRYDGDPDVSPFSINTNFWYLWRMSSTILVGNAHRFLNIEPMLCDICEVEDERNGGKLIENFLKPKNQDKSIFEWVIVGAETGNRKGKVAPEKEWLEKLHSLCTEAGTPLFMKNSLKGIWEGELVQEYPEGLKNTPKMLDNRKGEGSRS